jgi:hypothetical protein
VEEFYWKSFENFDNYVAYSLTDYIRELFTNDEFLFGWQYSYESRSEVLSYADTLEFKNFVNKSKECNSLFLGLIHYNDGLLKKQSDFDCEYLNPVNCVTSNQLWGLIGLKNNKLCPKGVSHFPRQYYDIKRSEIPLIVTHKYWGYICVNIEFVLKASDHARMQEDMSLPNSLSSFPDYRYRIKKEEVSLKSWIEKSQIEMDVYLRNSNVYLECFRYTKRCFKNNYPLLAKSAILKFKKKEYGVMLMYVPSKLKNEEKTRMYCNPKNLVKNSWHFIFEKLNQNIYSILGVSPYHIYSKSGLITRVVDYLLKISNNVKLEQIIEKKLDSLNVGLHFGNRETWRIEQWFLFGGLLSFVFNNLVSNKQMEGIVSFMKTVKHTFHSILNESWYEDNKKLRTKWREILIPPTNIGLLNECWGNYPKLFEETQLSNFCQRFGPLSISNDAYYELCHLSVIKFMNHYNNNISYISNLVNLRKTFLDLLPKSKFNHSINPYLHHPTCVDKLKPIEFGFIQELKEIDYKKKIFQTGNYIEFYNVLTKKYSYGIIESILKKFTFSGHYEKIYIKAKLLITTEAAFKFLSFKIGDSIECIELIHLMNVVSVVQFPNSEEKLINPFWVKFIQEKDLIFSE